MKRTASSTAAGEDEVRADRLLPLEVLRPLTPEGLARMLEVLLLPPEVRADGRKVLDVAAAQAPLALRARPTKRTTRGSSRSRRSSAAAARSCASTAAATLRSHS